MSSFTRSPSLPQWWHGTSETELTAAQEWALPWEALFDAKLRRWSKYGVPILFIQHTPLIHWILGLDVYVHTDSDFYSLGQSKKANMSRSISYYEAAASRGDEVAKKKIHALDKEVSLCVGERASLTK